MDWARIYEFLFHSNATLAFIFLAGAVGLLLAALVSRAVKHAGVYAGGLSIAIGGVWLAVLGNGITVQTAATSLSCLAILGGVLYLTVFLSLSLLKRREIKRKEREEQARRVQYSLPDKENAYLRARLHMVLQTPEEPSKKTMPSEKYFRLEHARKMLSCLKEKPLSVAERLEMDELRAIVSLYEKKERVEAEELRTVNDAFARILKLSAKYEVACKGL